MTRNLAFNLLDEELFLVCLLIGNFENKLLASIEIIIPRIKIEKVKIY